MAEENNNLTWSIFPISEETGKAILFLLAVIIVPLVIQSAFQERWLTVISMVFLLGSLRMFWSPTWFEITKEGVVVRTLFYRVTHKWERFKVIKDDKRGLLLTPFKSDSRLETFRGLFLRLPPNSQDLKLQVRKQCKEFLGIVSESISSEEVA